MTINKHDASGYWKANLRIIAICLVVWALCSYGFGIVLRPALSSISIGADGRVSRVMLEMPSDDPALNAHAVRLMYRCALPPEVSAECEGTITLQPPLVPASPGH